MKSHYIIIFMILACTLISGCTALEQNGSPFITNTTPQSIAIGSLLEDPTGYQSREVEVSGKISAQCGSGCWFIISDDSGDLYVNLKPNNFVIPPAMGKEATITGTVKVKGSDASLIGSSVVVDGKTYP